MGGNFGGLVLVKAVVVTFFLALDAVVVVVLVIVISGSDSRDKSICGASLPPLRVEEVDIF